MTTSSENGAKRVACVGEEDPAYVVRIVHELEQRGLSARHLSTFALKIAPRPPDLTVILGKAADDGGASVVRAVGDKRGPFAVVVAPSALAARLDARQRGLHVVERKDDGAETGALIAQLLEAIAEGKVATPSPNVPAPSVALDALDWDEDGSETVSQPRMTPVAGRGVPRAPAVPRPIGERVTLRGVTSPPPRPRVAKPDPNLAFDEVTERASASRGLHDEVTTPRRIDPGTSDPHLAVTRPVALPEAPPLDLDFGYDTLAEPKSADVDRTAPHAAMPPTEPEAPRPPPLPKKPKSTAASPFARTLMGLSEPAPPLPKADAKTLVPSPPKSGRSLADIARDGLREAEARADEKRAPRRSISKAGLSAFGAAPAQREAGGEVKAAPSEPEPSAPTPAASASAFASTPAIDADKTAPVPSIDPASGAAALAVALGLQPPSAPSTEAEPAIEASAGSEVATAPLDDVAESAGTPSESPTAPTPASEVESPSAPIGGSLGPSSMPMTSAAPLSTGLPSIPDAAPLEASTPLVPASAPPAWSPPPAMPSAPIASNVAPAPASKKGGALLFVVAGVGTLVILLGIAAVAGYFLVFLPRQRPVATDETPARELAASPAASAPVVAQPAVAQPAVAQPGVAQPAVAQPTAAPSPVAAPAAPAEPAPEAPELAAAEPAPSPAPPEPAAPPQPSAPPSDDPASLSPEEARAQSDVFVREGEQAMRNQRLDDARAAFAQAAEVYDLNPHAHEGLARVELAAGNAQAAVEHAERAASLRRRRSSYQVLLGDARRAAGDEAGARRAYERALDIDPDDTDARERLGS